MAYYSRYVEFEVLATYHMDFITFERLVDLLTPFLRLTTVTFVRPPIPIRKEVKLVLYRLAHEVSCARMHNLYGCGESTIRKYTMIVWFYQCVVETVAYKT